MAERACPDQRELSAQRGRPSHDLRETAGGAVTIAALRQIGGATPAERLASLRAAVPGRIVFTTSFGIEDQAIAHLIFTARLRLEVVTLDTGRLFSATYDLWAQTEERYGVRIRSLHPDQAALAAFVADSGINGFYHSKAARTDCC